MARLKMVYLPSAEFARLLRFYRDALGLDLRFQDGERWAGFSAAQCSFAVSNLAEAPDGATGAVIVLETDDLDRDAVRIVEYGGQVRDRRDMGSHGTTLAFHDTAGNTLQLFQLAGWARRPMTAKRDIDDGR